MRALVYPCARCVCVSVDAHMYMRVDDDTCTCERCACLHSVIHVHHIHNAPCTCTRAHGHVPVHAYHRGHMHDLVHQHARVTAAACLRTHMLCLHSVASRQGAHTRACVNMFAVCIRECLCTCLHACHAILSHCYVEPCPANLHIHTLTLLVSISSLSPPTSHRYLATSK